VSAIHSSARKVFKVNHSNININTNEGKIELDTHADTSCASAHVCIIDYTGQTCSVSVFSHELPTMTDVPIINGAVAYDHPETGEVFIIAMNQHLYLGDKIENSLICLNQCRYNNVIVDDVPLHLSDTSTHSLYFTEEDVHIPLQLNGCISHINMRYPTDHEINNCTWLQLTADTEWDPYSPNISTYEEKEIRKRRTVSAIHCEDSTYIDTQEQHCLA
jgi:hypothetical protein